jgi:hypothetical protein
MNTGTSGSRQVVVQYWSATSSRQVPVLATTRTALACMLREHYLGYNFKSHAIVVLNA